MKPKTAKTNTRNSVKDIILFVGKILVSVVLLFILFRRIDFENVLSYIKQINVVNYCAAFIIIVIGVFLSTLKWRFLLQNIKIHASFWILLKWYYIGTFFNMFMPSTVGGDVVRVTLYGKDNKRMTETALSVFVERLTGVFALFAIAIVSFSLNIKLFIATPIVYVMAGIIFVEICLLVFFIKPKIAKIFFRIGITLSSRFRIQRLIKLLKNLYKALIKIHDGKSHVVAVFILSFVFQFISIFANALVSESLSLGIPIAYFFTLVPLVALFAMIPISFNGVGLREFVAVFLYGALHIQDSKAISLSLMIFFLLIVNSLVGGLFFLLHTIYSSKKDKG